MKSKGSLPHAPARSSPYPTFYFLKIHLNIILPTMLGLPRGLFFLGFPHQNPVYASALPHTYYMPCPCNSSRFYHPNNIGRGVQIISTSLWGFLHSLVTLSILGPNIPLNTLFSDILSLCSSLNVSNQVSCP